MCLPPGIDGHAALQLPDVERALEMQPALLEPGAAAIGPTGLMRTSSLTNTTIAMKPATSSRNRPPMIAASQRV